ncbi:MAG: PLDc N-terminal domain-containing protein [Chitinophagaceae bacterium]
MKNLRHPSFILAIISIVVTFVGIGIKAYGYRGGDYVIIAAVVLGAIHYIWTIFDVAGKNDMKPFQKRFWLIAVIAAPVLGGMLFYTMHQKAGKITT